MALNSKRPSTSRREVAEKIKADLAGQGADKPKRLNVIVDESLLRRMKRHALNEDKTISEITRELWLTHMSK